MSNLATNPTLVVTDLDGSLWDNSLMCHPAVLAAVRELQARDDVVLLAATGRRRNSARRAFGLNDIVMPAVLLNGATGYDFTREELFHTVTWKSADLAHVLGVLGSFDVGPVAYLVDGRAMVVEGVTTSVKHLDSLGDDLVWVTVDALATRDDVMGMSMLGIDRAAVLGPLEALRDDPIAEVAAYADHLYPPFSFMVAPPGINKVVGISAYLDERALVPGRTIAVGDGGNDLEMLSWADHAVVVETGVDEAKALADTIIPGPADGGWARVLDLVQTS